MVNRKSEPELKTFQFSKEENKQVFVNKGAEFGSDVNLEKSSYRYTVNSNDVMLDAYLGTDTTYSSRGYRDSLKSLKPFRPSCKDGKVPINKVGLLSYLFVSWMSTLIWRIYKHRDKPLREEDVWQCSDWETSNVNTERMKRIWNNEIKKRGSHKASVLRVWLKFTRTRLLIVILITCINAVLTFIMEGYMTQLFVTYVEASESNLAYALGLVAVSVVGQILRAISFVFIIMFGVQTGVRFRAGMLGLIYDKMLKLKNVKGKSMAEIITLFGADSLRMYMNCISFVYLLALPVYLIIGTVYLYYLIEYWCFIPVAIFFLCYQLQAFLMNLVSKIRRKVLVFTDKRIRKMTEILNSMKLIKMYAWEDSFQESVQSIRKHEKRKLLITAIIDSISEAVIPVAPTLATVATLAPYYATGHEIKASLAFAVVATLNYMRIILSFTPFASRVFGECRISFERAKRVLIMEEYEAPNSVCIDGENSVEITGATFKWDNVENNNEEKSKTAKKEGELKEDVKTQNQNNSKKESFYANGNVKKSASSTSLQLEGVHLNVKKGNIIGICGQVGCGKSSLISAILGRMPLLSGHLAVSGSVAYAAQQAWIFNGTVQENILFGKPYDCEWYQEVVSACGLESDLEIMANGDQTEIGDRGINISGGQKQRLSLARAVYSKSDIYLLDDPLSAVDVHVGRHLFHKCIKKLLKGKTVVLVTHQLQYLKHCDEIVTMNGGEIVEQGHHDSLLSCGGYYSDMMLKFHSATGHSKNNNENEELQELNEQQNKDEDEDSIFMKIPNNDIHKEKKSSLFSSDTPEDKLKGKLTTNEEVQAGNVGAGIYASYIRAMGGIGTFLIMFIGFSIAMGSTVFSDYWLSLWLEKINVPTTEDDQDILYKETGGILNSEISTVYVPNNNSVPSNQTFNHIYAGVTFDIYFIVYCSSVVVILIFALLKGFIAATATIRAAGNLHDGALLKVLKAPMSFFDANPSGRIINRFSRDMDEVDVFIPRLIDASLQILLVIILSVVVAGINLPWILLSIPPMCIMCFVINKISSVTIRQIRRFENVARSPLLGHVSTSGQGLFTVVPFKQQQQFIETCMQYTDVTSTGLILFEGSMRWIGLLLDLTASMISVTTSLVMVLTKGSISPALAALSLTLTVRNVSIMQFAVRMMNELEARFTSVERIHEYKEVMIWIICHLSTLFCYARPIDPANLRTMLQINSLESEVDKSLKTPDSSWPQEGNLKFSNAVMKYRQDMDPVLRHITFEVKPREKIGIVGRTGAGKSSLAVALFRLSDLSEGNIYVDGVDIADISRKSLRSKLSTIPQDPVLFAGTLRYNLDPFNDYTDIELWSALEQVKIKEKVMAYETQLEYIVEENGENFSVGERQLICLARAILRKNKILILDEATASIDTATDALIQQTIRESFSHCTVLTIAHRLNTVLHCDRVFIIETGQILEAGTPQDLLVNQKSFFNAMIAAQTIKTPSP